MNSDANPYRSSCAGPSGGPRQPASAGQRKLAAVCYGAAFLGAMATTMLAFVLAEAVQAEGWNRLAVVLLAVTSILACVTLFSAAYGGRLRHGGRNVPT